MKIIFVLPGSPFTASVRGKGTPAFYNSADGNNLIKFLLLHSKMVAAL